MTKSSKCLSCGYKFDLLPMMWRTKVDHYDTKCKNCGSSINIKELKPLLIQLCENLESKYQHQTKLSM